MPDANAITKTLGYKFIFDPQFNVYVNGVKVEYHNTLQPDKEDALATPYGELNVSIYRIPDGEKSTARVPWWRDERRYHDKLE